MAPEILGFDVVVVGGGPAGLSAAIKIRQLAAAQGPNVTVSILEMGSSHIRSGAVIDPIALTDLLPNWKEKGASFATPVTEGRLLFLATVPPIYKSEARSHTTPTPDATLECGHTIGPAGRLGYSVAASRAA
jgi:flavin-dependent dehydrogenase